MLGTAVCALAGRCLDPEDQGGLFLYGVALPHKKIGAIAARIAVLETSIKTSAPCDALVEREKRPQEGSDPWRAGWMSNEHRPLQIPGLGELGQRSVGGQGLRAREGSERNR